MRRRWVIGLVALFASLVTTSPVSAYQLTQYSPTSFFDGTGSTAGPFGNTIGSMDVDQQAG